MASLNTDVSDLSINDPRSLSPAHPGTGSTEFAGHNAPQRSPMNGDWPLSPHYNNGLQNGPPATQSPYMNATPLAPMEENAEGMLQPPPPLLSSTPKRIPSPVGRKSASVAGSINRPDSRDFSGSQAGSRPGSRAASPSRFSRRPTTPGTEGRLKKRLSWMPGRSPQPSESDNEGRSQAWTVSSNERIPYDLDPLLHFQRVSILDIFLVSLRLTTIFRYMSFGTRMEIRWSTCTTNPQDLGLPFASTHLALRHLLRLCEPLTEKHTPLMATTARFRETINNELLQNGRPVSCQMGRSHQHPSHPHLLTMALPPSEAVRQAVVLPETISTIPRRKRIFICAYHSQYRPTLTSPNLICPATI